MSRTKILLTFLVILVLPLCLYAAGDIGIAGGVMKDSITAEHFADDDWGDLSVSSNSVAIDDDVISKANFADEDWGDVSVSSNSVTIDSGAVDSTAIADGTIVNADISSSAAIANSKLAAPNSYFTVCIHHEGQETATVDPVATFQMPFAATLVEVSATARDIDTTDGNETYTVDLEEAGTSVLDSAISITADNTPVVGTITDADIADNAKMEVVLTLGGTSAAIDDLTILLTFKVAHTN